MNYSFKMKKIALVIVTLLLFSCNKREVLLPKIDRTIIEKVDDLSPIYIFFKVDGKDTIADLNRKNAISSTNFIFNIDKRLPLKLVLPEVIKVQIKKASSMHSNENSENYYSYSDNAKKSLAFVPFTKVNYKLEKPNYGVQIYFKKDSRIFVFDFYSKEKKEVKKEDLFKYLISIPCDKPNKYVFCHDIKSNYEKFIKNNVFIAELKLQIPTKNLTNEEFVF